MSGYTATVRSLLGDAATFGRSIEFLETVDSTNRVVGERAEAGAPEGTAVVAETQLAGRGRRGRVWISPPGVNIYCSLILRPRVAPARLGQLPLVAAAALHRALSATVPAAPLLIKWPNDILAGGGRKVAGILCEAGVEAGAVRHAVVGIGVNVNGRTFPPALAGVATSLAQETGAEHSRAPLLAAVLGALEEDYCRWCAAADLAGFLPYLQSHSALQGREVAAEGPGGRSAGRVEGISPEGELMLRDAGGATLRICSGDVRIVPLGRAAEEAGGR
jgi:BirA family biotin operon repressor/biotin-[acetyl-CoA-carboxylase] ligase